jgi:pantetheine-phosphate adenylyltransferase
MRRAVFPGSFDPITLGHVDIIQRALPLFDEIIIAIGVNAEKTNMWSLQDRTSFIEKTFVNESKVKVKTYSGLTVQKKPVLFFVGFGIQPISLTSSLLHKRMLLWKELKVFS